MSYAGCSESVIYIFALKNWFLKVFFCNAGCAQTRKLFIFKDNGLYKDPLFKCFKSVKLSILALPVLKIDSESRFHTKLHSVTSPTNKKAFQSGFENLCFSISRRPISNLKRSKLGKINFKWLLAAA